MPDDLAPAISEPSELPIGLTPEEIALVTISADLWNVFVRLGGHTQAELRETERDIHNIQNRIMARAATRAHPHVFRKWESVV